ncbi:hypothetical protein ALC57_05815 [Trachymyrmex cornetzi]|uniref:Uncharacterized protein n=1 Tax=Trachymyrmex cornetzi TaxID=471704 RepID=A0A151JA37_9HYME|nr:hypothetical protein ALC57_05815 [Trachymyrmex cornetzi]
MRDLFVTHPENPDERSQGQRELAKISKDGLSTAKKWRARARRAYVDVARNLPSLNKAASICVTYDLTVSCKTEYRSGCIKQNTLKAARVKTAEMAGGKNGRRQERRRKSRGKEEEEEEDDNDDDEDDEESSCSRIAYRSVSPKATEPLILIIGYNLVAANSCQSDKCTAINSIWKCGAQQTANSQIKKRVFLSKWERSYRSDLTKADLRADIHFTSEPLLLVPPLIVFCPSLLISRGLSLLAKEILAHE